MKTAKNCIYKWRIGYVYNNPCGAGPFKGTVIVESDEKPVKGDFIYGLFGGATIKTVSKLNIAMTPNREVANNVEFQP